MNTGLVGNLTWDKREMMLRATSMKDGSIKKIQDEFTPLVLKTIDWSKVDNNSWFICVNSTKNKGYSFPIAEGENRDDSYARVKHGMKHFISQGWEAYKIR